MEDELAVADGRSGCCGVNGALLSKRLPVTDLARVPMAAPRLVERRTDPCGSVPIPMAWVSPRTNTIWLRYPTTGLHSSPPVSAS